jgi:hypothetical protein
MHGMLRQLSEENHFSKILQRSLSKKKFYNFKTNTMKNEYDLMTHYVHSYLQIVKRQLFYKADDTVEIFIRDPENRQTLENIGMHVDLQYGYRLQPIQLEAGVSMFLKTLRR